MRIVRLLPAMLLLVVSLPAQQISNPAVRYRIGGVVVNAATGEPLARTKVMIATTDERTRMTAMVTKADGKFVLEGLAPGKYQLVAQRAGYPTQSFNQHENFSSAIAVGPDKNSTELVFRLQPEAVISGTILDEANEAVREAEVVLFHRAVEEGQFNTHVVRMARSDDQGFYHFEQLIAGDYLVAVKARPWYAQAMSISSTRVPANQALNVAFPLTLYPGVTEADQAGVLKVRSGDHISADFLLRAMPAVRLHVKSNSRQFSAHLTQKIFEDYDTFVQTQNTFENEQFTISGIAPGQYTLHADFPEGSGGAQEIAITDDMSVDADALMNRGLVNVTGIVSLYGTALPGRMIIRMESQSPHQEVGAQVMSDGKFEIKQVPPGNYTISMSTPTIYVAQIAASGARANGRMVKIGSNDVTLAVQVSQGAGRINGTVMLGETPQAGAMVLLVPDNAAQNSSLFRRDQSDSDGTFTLANVVPGHYSLLAIMDGWDLPYSQARVVKPYLAKAESVTVQPNGKYDVKVALQDK